MRQLLIVALLAVCTAAHHGKGVWAVSGHTQPYMLVAIKTCVKRIPVAVYLDKDEIITMANPLAADRNGDSTFFTDLPCVNVNRVAMWRPRAELKR